MTWEARNNYNTIDLIFMTSRLIKYLKHYTSRKNVRQFSDYILVSTYLHLSSKTLSSIKFQAFKLLNMNKLQKAKQNMPSS